MFNCETPPPLLEDSIPLDSVRTEGSAGQRVCARENLSSKAAALRKRRRTSSRRGKQSLERRVSTVETGDTGTEVVFLMQRQEPKKRNKHAKNALSATRLGRSATFHQRESQASQHELTLNYVALAMLLTASLHEQSCGNIVMVAGI